VLHMPYIEMARATSVDATTLHPWRSPASTSSGGFSRRLSARAGRLEVLERVFDDGVCVRRWPDEPLSWPSPRRLRGVMAAGVSELLMGKILFLGNPSTRVSP
jgi:hypothetical protein